MMYALFKLNFDAACLNAVTFHYIVVDFGV